MVGITTPITLRGLTITSTVLLTASAAHSMCSRPIVILANSSA